MCVYMKLWVHTKVKTAISDLFYLCNMLIAIAVVYAKLFLVMVYFSKWHRGEGCWRIKWESLTWGEDMAVVVVGQRVVGQRVLGGSVVKNKTIV